MELNARLENLRRNIAAIRREVGHVTRFPDAIRAEGAALAEKLGVAAVASQVGIPIPTLYSWRNNPPNIKATVAKELPIQVTRLGVSPSAFSKFKFDVRVEIFGVRVEVSKDYQR